MTRKVTIYFVLTVSLLANTFLIIKNRRDAATVKLATAAIKTLPSGKYFVGDRSGGVMTYCIDPNDTLTVGKQYPRSIVVNCGPKT
jgi:hypothetical protein